MSNDNRGRNEEKSRRENGGGTERPKIREEN
jgi:hypothetical protein